MFASSSLLRILALATVTFSLGSVACEGKLEDPSHQNDGALTQEPDDDDSDGGAEADSGASPPDAQAPALVGVWTNAKTSPLGGFARLALRDSGAFELSQDVSASADCAPDGEETRCLTPHAGQYTVDAKGEVLTLNFEENGRVIQTEVTPFVVRGDTLVLSRTVREETLVRTAE